MSHRAEISFFMASSRLIARHARETGDYTGRAFCEIRIAPQRQLPGGGQDESPGM
jgi:hypothetical protein